MKAFACGSLLLLLGCAHGRPEPRRIEIAEPMVITAGPPGELPLGEMDDGQFTGRKNSVWLREPERPSPVRTSVNAIVLLVPSVNWWRPYDARAAKAPVPTPPLPPSQRNW